MKQLKKPEAVDVIQRPERAQVILHPTRIAILERLAEPTSAASLARQLEMPRQRLNYHLHELESQRLVTLAGRRKRGSAVENFYQRTGHSYAIAVDALGGMGSTPETVQDRFSSAYQIAMCSRVISEVAEMRSAAAAAKQELPTFSLEFEVRFSNAQQRSAFTAELTELVAGLIQKYHDDAAPKGRSFRYYAGAYPKKKPPAVINGR